MPVFDKYTTVSEAERPLFGRRELSASFTKENLSVDEIKMILEEVLPSHLANVQDIQYLQGYLSGNQKILSKTKLIRPEINNKILENNAYHIVEFKKGYVFGDPIQYVQMGEDTAKEEIEILNQYFAENDKPSKDKDLSEDWYVCGTAFRFIKSVSSEFTPFEFYNLDPKQAGVVYSTDIDKKPLFGFYLVKKSEMVGNTLKDYGFVTVYTKFNIYNFRFNVDKLTISDLKYVKDNVANEVNKLGEIPIIEYPLNMSRYGLIELVMPTLDALNLIASNEMDDIQQFVQSLIVLVNADIDLMKLAEAKAGGVMLVKDSNAQFKADIKTISNKLQHSETKVLSDRLYNQMLTIAGVPRMSDKASSGDTGQARLVGEGWTMADERAKQDELSFKVSEKRMLKLILKICKLKPTQSNIKTLQPKDIEIKFSRNKSDNMLVKAQTLIDLKTAGVDPEIAFRTVEFWSDPAAVLKASKLFYGSSFWKEAQSGTLATPESATKQVGDVTNPIGVNANPK